MLVLGAGGPLGDAWMGGVLAGIAAETGIDFRERASRSSAPRRAQSLLADLLAGRRAAGERSGWARWRTPAERDEEEAALLAGDRGSSRSDTDTGVNGDGRLCLSRPPARR